MMRKNQTPWVVVAGLVVILLMAGCTAIPAKPTPTLLGKPEPPLEVDLSLSGKPLLGSTQTMTFTVKPLIEAPNASITITLPAEIELVSGALTWQGELSKEEETQFPIQVRIAATGYYRILATADFTPGPGVRYWNGSLLYFVVDGTAGWAGKQPPKNNWVASNIGIPGRDDPSRVGQLDVQVYLTEPLQWGKETELVYEVTSSVGIADRVSIGLILPKVGLTVVSRKDPDQETLSFYPPKTLENRVQSDDPSFSPPDSDSVMRWEGYLNKGDPAVIRLKIKPTTTGEGSITAYINTPDPNGGTGALLYSRSLSLKVYTPNLAE